jgi:UDP-GlcNAc3NAcA epimerase
MKMLTVVGTRPQFIYELLVHRYAKERGVDEVVVHAGQHYDHELSQQFFDELELPVPRHHLQLTPGPAVSQTGQMLAQLETIVDTERPNVTLVHGDVDTTLAAALASARLRVPVAHIEAGLRSGYFYNPEEINRRLTDHLSELNFPHIQEAYDSLISEGFPPERVLLAGDILLDTLLYIKQKCGITERDGDYLYATVHRAENTDDPARLGSIVDAFVRSGERIVFPVHLRTQARLQQFGLLDKLRSARNVELSPPIGYTQSINLLAGCKKVLTDSGGVRREAYILGKPVITLIEIVWVPLMAKIGWSKIVGADTDQILDAIRHHAPTCERPPIFGDGTAHRRIIDAVIERFGDARSKRG